MKETASRPSIPVTLLLAGDLVLHLAAIGSCDALAADAAYVASVDAFTRSLLGIGRALLALSAGLEAVPLLAPVAWSWTRWAWSLAAVAFTSRTWSAKIRPTSPLFGFRSRKSVVPHDDDHTPILVEVWRWDPARVVWWIGCLALKFVTVVIAGFFVLINHGAVSRAVDKVFYEADPNVINNMYDRLVAASGTQLELMATTGASLLWILVQLWAGAYGLGSGEGGYTGST
ncbi:hypothetical protein H9P43_000774 [Blastocladiella emersonii ATCC 22665]|nr:hypothetical protein H9P43_000774 [Blastocladiella emersonii ATCC 22665]